MVRITQALTAFALLAATSVYAQTCDNSNGLSGSGKGGQFITGCCATDADCGSGCCSFLRGQCVGAVVAQERASDGGCGHGGASPNSNAASSIAAGQPAVNTLATSATAASSAAAAPASGTTAAAAAGCSQNANTGLGNGSQFITGCCKADKDCASGCCSFLRGQCVGAVVAQERAADGGCGFGNTSPNSSAAAALTKLRRAERTAAAAN